MWLQALIYLVHMLVPGSFITGLFVLFYIVVMFSFAASVRISHLYG